MTRLSPRYFVRLSPCPRTNSLWVPSIPFLGYIFLENLSLAHFFSPLLNQIMAQSHHQNPAPLLGAGTLFLYGTGVAVAGPFNTVVLRSHVGVLNVTPLGAYVSLRTNRLLLLNVHRESIGVVGPRVRIRTGGS